MHKAPPPMPDTDKLKGFCGLTALAIIGIVVGVPAALAYWAISALS